MFFSLVPNTQGVIFQLNPYLRSLELSFEEGWYFIRGSINQCFTDFMSVHIEVILDNPRFNCVHKVPVPIFSHGSVFKVRTNLKNKNVQRELGRSGAKYSIVCTIDMCIYLFTSQNDSTTNSWQPSRHAGSCLFPSTPPTPINIFILLFFLFYANANDFDNNARCTYLSIIIARQSGQNLWKRVPQ